MSALPSPSKSDQTRAAAMGALTMLIVPAMPKCTPHW